MARVLLGSFPGWALLVSAVLCAHVGISCSARPCNYMNTTDSKITGSLTITLGKEPV